MVESGSAPEEDRESVEQPSRLGPADGASAGGAEPTDPFQAVPSASVPSAGGGEEILEALPAPPFGDVEKLAELPALIRAARPPHPTFWWAVLWCGLYLIVTQVIPVLAITAVVIVVEILQAPDVKTGLDRLGTPEGQERSQHRVLLPALLASQAFGVALSWLALRIVAGRSWKRQVALRPPGKAHFVLALLGVPALPILATGIYWLAQRWLPGLAQILPFLGTEVFVLGVFWFVLWLVAGAHWNRALVRKPPSVQLLFVFFGVAAVVLSTVGAYWLTTQLLPTWLVNLPFPRAAMEEAVKEFRKWPWPAGVLIIGLGPGLCEELWCRGFLARGLVGHYGVILGVLLTSFLFGLLHGDPHQGTMAMLMGIVLHIAYLTTRSLLVPMLLHFLNNSLTVLAPMLGDKVERIDTNPEAISPFVYLASALLLTAVGWALYRSRARLGPADGDGPLTWEPAVPSVAHPPPGTNAVVVHPAVGWEEWLVVTAATVVFGCAFVFM